MSELIDVLLIEPGRKARKATIMDNLETMQEIVGGLIEEYMPFEDDVAIICNEEGKIMQLPPCRAINDDKGRVIDIIAGPFFMAYAPMDSESFLSLPDHLMEKYYEKFEQPERFLRTENGIDVIKIQDEDLIFEAMFKYGNEEKIYKDFKDVTGTGKRNVKRNRTEDLEMEV